MFSAYGISTEKNGKALSTVQKKQVGYSGGKNLRVTVLKDRMDFIGYFQFLKMNILKFLILTHLLK